VFTHRKYDAAVERKLIIMRNLCDEYHQWRALYESLIHNDMLQLHPNYEIIMARIVQLGTEARERYHNTVLDFFTPDDQEDLFPKSE